MEYVFFSRVLMPSFVIHLFQDSLMESMFRLYWSITSFDKSKVSGAPKTVFFSDCDCVTNFPNKLSHEIFLLDFYNTKAKWKRLYFKFLFVQHFCDNLKPHIKTNFPEYFKPINPITVYEWNTWKHWKIKLEGLSDLGHDGLQNF